MSEYERLKAQKDAIVKKQFDKAYAQAYADGRRAGLEEAAKRYEESDNQMFARSVVDSYFDCRRKMLIMAKEKWMEALDRALQEPKP